MSNDATELELVHDDLQKLLDDMSRNQDSYIGNEL